MNSYYSNRIEGQHTTPSELESALNRDYSNDLSVARKQRLSIAHINVEQSLESEWHARPASDLFTLEDVRHIHSKLYESIPESERLTPEGHVVVPGEFRNVNVRVGHHHAPEPTEISTLMTNWEHGYRRTSGIERCLIAAISSHHRLAWIHPFRDGNGRASRLHLHLILDRAGLTHGLWSPLRGFARDVERYYGKLSAADSLRWNDTDGRGPLSERKLIEWVEYGIDVCVDQSTFMSSLLSLDTFKKNLAVLISVLEARPWMIRSQVSVIRSEALEPLHYVALSGPIDRGRFTSMTGLGDRTARRVLASLLDYGLLSSPSPRGPVAFALPFASLRFLFPRLWPESSSNL